VRSNTRCTTLRDDLDNISFDEVRRDPGHACLLTTQSDSHRAIHCNIGPSSACRIVRCRKEVKPYSREAPRSEGRRHMRAVKARIT
jgi:hypothetical protein